MLVVLAATAAGAGVGVGLGAITADDPVAELMRGAATEPASTSATSAGRTSTGRTSTGRTSTGRTSTNPRPSGQRTTTAPSSAAPTPSIRVQSATLVPAETPSGQQRQRARLTVNVRVVNRGTEPLDIRRRFVIVGEDRVSADPQADDAAGALLEPIAGGETVTGELRFETAGAVTQSLIDRNPARLRIAERSISLNDITITPPGQQPDQPAP